MYYETEIVEIVRVPPSRFNEPLKDVALEICEQQFENTVNPSYGMIVAVIDILEVGLGKIIPGDGGTYHKVRFRAVTYLPKQGEILQGEVTEVTRYGVFIRAGCVDVLCHISQIQPKEKFRLVSRTQHGILLGTKTGRSIRTGDIVRAKVINVSVDQKSIKVAVKMSEEGLGPQDWIKNQEETDKKEVSAE